ncbi:MAG: polyketide cyclase [Anaerolineae bacterium]|nr:polyketide cyclase [Anaerolineae bacterium]
MASNEYHFITHWRVQGTAREVFEILADAPDLSRWWPAVYLDVQQVQPGDSQGVGKVVSLYTKGWLPYTLRWQFRVTEANPPYGFSLEAWGDFVGRGIWTFEQADEWLNITYDWRIRADKPLLRSLSFIFKPIFAANHRWAMAKGEESLRLELARRRARTAEERALIPAPPGPISTSPLPLLLMGAAILAGGVTLIYVARRK